MRRKWQSVFSRAGDLEDARQAVLTVLVSTLAARHSEAQGHAERVVRFSLLLGAELGISDEQMVSLKYGALLHDIGKIGVPDAILHKPSALTPAEWERMREHPARGEKILDGIDFLEGAARVVAQHHEKWDGSGYPRGLRGEGIDLNARIVAVSDAFDAIVSDRVYRAGQSYERAAAELLRCSGTHFDPRAVEAFRRVPRRHWDSVYRPSAARGVCHAVAASSAGAP